jgi:hypothetical protein
VSEFVGIRKSGALNLASSNLTYLQVYSNQLTAINFTNCSNLKTLYARRNNLGPSALEHILGEIYTNCHNISEVYLDGNGCTTSNGYWFCVQLRKRCAVFLDEPSMDLGGGWSMVQSRIIHGSDMKLNAPTTQGNLLVCFVKDPFGDSITGCHDINGTNWLEAPMGSVPYYSGVATGALHVFYTTNAFVTTELEVQGGGEYVMGFVEISGAAAYMPIHDYCSMTGPGQNDIYANYLACGGSLDSNPTNNMTLAFGTCAQGPMGLAGGNYTTLNTAGIEDEYGIFGVAAGTVNELGGSITPRIHNTTGYDTWAFIAIQFHP